MSLERIPSVMLTLFAELLQQAETAPPAGSAYRRTLKGAEYLYAKMPVGGTRRDRFLGRADETEAVALAAELKLGADLAAQRRRLVALLRRDGFRGPDRTTGAVLDAVAQAGLFRRGAVLVGTAAYQMSEALAGCRLPFPTRTPGCLELAVVDVAAEAELHASFERILKRADPTFSGLPDLDPGIPVSRFRNSGGYGVDLAALPPSTPAGDPVRRARQDVAAASLKHLAWLIEGPVRTAALWGAGVVINVPQPARSAVHKLILAQTRDAADRLRRAEDLAQAAALIEALRSTDPFALEDALANARGRGERGWSAPIGRSVKALGAIASEL